ncbi:hypothetical protein [Legionella jamestowniensis]|uniref:Protein IcmL (DotI) n=1 Tax=Legionella jamestowniensis TaxID=455 RepID=A0A0W0UJ36_9GAMM|nr:hypothetical protein [Legionella jamestowniensis]KTD07866.1 hypothetical protein Ljam_2061 [Legionella jamestowniensis]OCH99003.1 hypothetical protein A8135_09645 [Legionella jamestowniensis]SFL63372.1 hypothetical protein SAMN02746073_1186 [Legionella jamestowniensis DSM 19215]
MRSKITALLLFFFLSSTYADDTTTKVGNWAQQVLMDTLSASYRDTPADIEEVQKNFLPEAWGPMHLFFLDKRVQINEEKLTLHPQIRTTPAVIESNNCSVSPCWQVKQSFNIPELSLTIDFTLQIVPASVVKKATSPFLIQSLSIVMHND